MSGGGLVTRFPSQRPLIGVSGPDEGGGASWIFTWLLLWRCGARARRLTPKRPLVLDDLDGVIIGGGADVTEPLAEALMDRNGGGTDAGPPGGPERQRWLMALLAPIIVLVRWFASKRGHGADPARDQLELRLLRYAEQERLPVLGICRGAQLMSVAHGGSLVRHVSTLYEERPRLYTMLPRRSVYLEPGTLMRRVMATDVLLVNSLHHHAVQSVGEGFRVAAREPEGVVQAIERLDPELWWGVQWHPEYLPQSPLQTALVRFWVGVCRRRRALRATARERRA